MEEDVSRILNKYQIVLHIRIFIIIQPDIISALNVMICDSISILIQYSTPVCIFSLLDEMLAMHGILTFDEGANCAMVE